MSDESRPGESLEQRLGLVARGVQRMADAFGSLEQRVSDLADAERLQALSDRVDEYRVKGRSEVAQVNERIERLEAENARMLELMRSVSRSIEAVSSRPAPSGGIVDITGPLDRMIDALAGLRDDIAASVGDLRVETAASIERLITEQGHRLTRLHDAIAGVRGDPSTGRMDELQRVLDEVLTEVRSVHGEVVTASGQLRTDIAADVAAMRGTLVPAAPVPAPVDDSRLAAIENVIAALRDEVAIDRLEASMRNMAEDTSGLRADVRRSFDRVLHEISTTEESLKGEVRAIDSRLSGFGEDLRLVRGLRDGLEALASGVDAVRQLAARSATSSQMGELAHDLSTVLAEIETARSQVLAVDQQVGRIQAETIEIAHAKAGEPDVRRDVQDLERKVTDDIADLGARIEAIAEKTVSAAEPEDPIAARLRSLATSARQLSMGIAEDLKARRAKPKRPRAKRS